MPKKPDRNNQGKYSSPQGEPLSKKPFCVKLPQSLHDVVLELDEPSEWVRQAIVEKAIAQGIWEPEQ